MWLTKFIFSDILEFMIENIIQELALQRINVRRGSMSLTNRKVGRGLTN